MEREIVVLYEDSEILVAQKPQDLVSEDAGVSSLPYYLREYRAERGDAGEIYPVHRLDKPTGGAILYAKTAEGAAGLSAAVAEHRTGKRYLAVTVGVPTAPEGELRDFLYHDKRQNKVFVVKGGRKGAKEAILSYKTLGTSESECGTLSLLEITLQTGRTHQIRAQLASRKCPLYGDRRYGAPASLTGGKIALWSHLLSFPRGKDTVTVTSDPPREFPWNLFQL